MRINKIRLRIIEEFNRNILIGNLLGDGTLVKKYINGNVYFKYDQGIKNKEYLYHVYNQYKEICNMKEPVYFKSKNTINEYYVFNTKSLKELKDYHNIFYININDTLLKPKYKKILPNNIEELLTIEAIAYWVMDDGGKTKEGMHISTESFTISEINKLIEILNNKYDIKCTLHERPPSGRIYVWVKGMKRLKELISPYLIPSMRYKIGE